MITGLGRSNTRYMAFPLLRYLARGGEVHSGQPRRENKVYEFHLLLWADMTKKGRALFFDRALMTADAKRDEWPIRLYWYMNSRWGPSWVRRELDKNGGQITERLGGLLSGAGIEYRRQLDAQGRPWLRRMFKTAMDRLTHWQPVRLIGGYRTDKSLRQPLEDKVTFWPTAEVAARYSVARSKAITQRDRRKRQAASTC